MAIPHHLQILLVIEMLRQSNAKLCKERVYKVCCCSKVICTAKHYGNDPRLQPHCIYIYVNQSLKQFWLEHMVQWAKWHSCYHPE